MSLAEETGLTVAAVQLRGSYRQLVSNRRFRRLWVSQLVSGIGDWLVIGFLMPLVTNLSGGSSFAVAGILIAKIIPALVFSSVIGVFVDLFDRRRLMIACDIVRAVLTFGLLWTNSLAVIYGVVLLMEMASMFFFPAKNALIPYLVEEQDLAAANGLSYTTQQASMLIGLTASGAILAGFEAIVRRILSADLPFVDLLVGPIAPELLGPRGGVFVNSLTFVWSAVAIYLIKVKASAQSEPQKVDLSLVGRDVLESFDFLKAHRELRGFLVTVGLAILGGGAIVPVGLVYVQQNLTGGVPFLEQLPVLERLIGAPQTFMMVFLALGMVLGALVVPKLADRLSLQLLFLGGVAAFAVSMGGFANIGIYWVAGLFAVGAGFCIATVTVAGNTYVVRTVADEIRGRVFTAMESVIRMALLVSMLVLAPVGDLTAGFVARLVEARGIAPASVTFTGSRITLQIASLIVVAAAVYAYRTLSWRACEDSRKAAAGGAGR